MECYSHEKCVFQEMDFCANQDFSCFNLSATIPSIGASFLEDFSFPFDETFGCSSFPPFGERLPPPELTEDSPQPNINAQPAVPFDFGLDFRFSNSIVDDYGGYGGVLGNGVHVSDVGAAFKDESAPEMPVFNMGFSQENERRDKVVKKVNGQPSKNLMAERRRRKRLNDRLSMLRSVVPKISKMDRTSILGDTIDYMKELLKRINDLRGEMDEGTSEMGELMSVFKNEKPNEVLVRNSSKFDVERSDGVARIKICCAMKPGLLLSTLTKLEELGLEIQHCVISCFSDFAMQALCSEEMKRSEAFEGEDMKQALFREAGYGGRCLHSHSHDV